MSLERTLGGEVDVTRFLGELPGDFAGLYQWCEVLGVGGQGFAVRAVQRTLQRSVVIKFLMRGGEQAEKRFLAEARLLSRIRSPHVIRLYDFGHVGSVLYLVLEYVPGRTLYERMKSPMDLQQVVDVAREVALGLVAIHGEGIVHRDLKPNNLWCAHGGRTKILDFGIARLALGEALTATGSFMGTPAYAAPEQIAGDPVDGRADLYALGVILYELVTGVNPFLGPALAQTVQRQMSLQIESVPRGRMAVPTGLENLIVNLLRKGADLRVNDAMTVLERLEHDFPGRSGLTLEDPGPELELGGSRYPGSCFEDPDPDGATPQSLPVPRDVTPVSNRASARVPRPPPVETPRRRLPVTAFFVGAALMGITLWLSTGRTPAPPSTASASTGPSVTSITEAEVTTSRSMIARVKEAAARSLQRKTRFDDAAEFDVSRLSQVDATDFELLLGTRAVLASHRSGLEADHDLETLDPRGLCLLAALEGWELYLGFRLISMKTIAGQNLSQDFPSHALAPAFRALTKENGADSFFKLRRFLAAVRRALQLCEESTVTPDTFPELVQATGQVGRLLEADRWREEVRGSKEDEIVAFVQALGSGGKARPCGNTAFMKLVWDHHRGLQSEAKTAEAKRAAIACLETLQLAGRIGAAMKGPLLEAAVGW